MHKNKSLVLSHAYFVSQLSFYMTTKIFNTRSGLATAFYSPLIPLLLFKYIYVYLSPQDLDVEFPSFSILFFFLISAKFWSVLNQTSLLFCVSVFYAFINSDKFCDE